jgi:hypothetical protein
MPLRATKKPRLDSFIAPHRAHRLLLCFFSTEKPMILRYHVPFYQEILAMPGLLNDPILSFGLQGIDQDAPPGSNPPTQRLRRFLTEKGKVRRVVNLVKRTVKPEPKIPNGFHYASLSDLLKARGCTVVSLDLFDSRADLQYDMNRPVPETEHQKYGTLLDIGCLEHLFDTAQCLENCMRMVRTGGHYLLHTPVNGYFGHGLHVFNPQGLIDCFTDNGFEIVYLKYSTLFGKPVSDPKKVRNAIIWLVGRKKRDIETFSCPQQKIWSSYYIPA